MNDKKQEKRLFDVEFLLAKTNLPDWKKRAFVRNMRLNPRTKLSIQSFNNVINTFEKLGNFNTQQNS